MLVNPNSTNKSEQILTLITQFYCSLSVRKDMQHISPQIRQFVIMRTDITNKEQTAKKILDFFLRLQSKLVNKSDKSWDQQFQMSTARGYALLKICQFPLRNSLIYALNRLKTPLKLTKRDSDTIMLDIEPPSEQLNIQIQKDVKTKTYYFFKWCQYVQHSKAVKQMKQREVENQKISLSFNKYGTKSNYFNAWKILYKKSKVQKQKIKKIQNSVNLNLLKQSLAVISDVAAIITIQSSLANKVEQKIVQVKKKSVLKKLRLNQSFVQHQAKYKKYSNQYAYIFLKHFLQKMKPLMNKSFQVQRARVEQDKKINFIRKCFQNQKKLWIESKSKLQQVIRYRKLTSLKCWKNDCEETVSFMDKSQKFENFLSIRRKRVVITILSFNKLVREEQFKKIQTLMETNGNSINSKSLKQVNLKKEIDNKRNDLIKYRSVNQKKRLISQVKLNYYLKNINLQIQSKIKQLLISTLKSRYHSYISKLDSRTLFLDKLEKKHLRVIQLSAFKNWRRLKFIKRQEQASVECMNRCSKKLILTNSWGKLRYRAFQKNCVETLAKSCQNIIFKLAYYKIAARSILINESVKKLQCNVDKKATRKLFGILVKNSKFNNERATLIQKITAKRYQVLLMNRLKNAHQMQKKSEEMKKKLEKAKLRYFFGQLHNKFEIQQSIQTKSIQSSKRIFLSYLKKTIRSSKLAQQYIQNKVQILSDQHRENQLNKFVQRLKLMKKEKDTLDQKQAKLIFKIVRRSILWIKQRISHQKVQKNVIRNRKMLELKRKQQALDILTIKHKRILTKSQIKKSRICNGFSDLIRLIKTKMKNKLCQQRLLNYKQTKDVTQVIKLMIAEKKKTEAKIDKIEELQQKSMNKKMKIFYGLLKNNKQNIENQMQLISIRKHALFSEFVATNLRCKFSRIKFNCSLKTYARNIMKKAFKSMKQALMKQKQKENMMRLDKTSSIVIQKSIEKSFKSNTLSQQIQRFNLRKSRHQIR